MARLNTKFTVLPTLLPLYSNSTFQQNGVFLIRITLLGERKTMAGRALIKQAFERYKKKNSGKVDIAELARNCDLAYGNVYNALYTDRKINMDIFIKLMRGLGSPIFVGVEAA